MNYSKWYYLRNKHRRLVATVIISYNVEQYCNAGFITTVDYSKHATAIFKHKNANEIIKDLAETIDIAYYDYSEKHPKY